MNHNIKQNVIIHGKSRSIQLSQVKAFFSRMWDAIDSRISRPQVKREHILLYLSLILIIVGSFLLRLLPVFSTDILLKGLDPWVQYRCAEYLNEHGLKAFLNWFDQSTWYPYGRNMGKSMYIAIPITAVIFYKIAIFLGFNTSMLTITYFVPAFFGAATAGFGASVFSATGFGVVSSAIFSSPFFIVDYSTCNIPRPSRH